MPTVLVPRHRFERWVSNFGDRHGETALSTVGGALSGAAADGSTFTARLPFEARYDGPGDATDFVGSFASPEDWGLLLVRKGGFAVGRVRADRLVESKVGQRHVQGRTKAGGQSQQRFARRRDNQARQAFEAAADHAARILATDAVGTEIPVVTGGDHPAVNEVLADRRLRHLRVVAPWITVPDQRRAALDQAVRDACSTVIQVINA